jgi:hypothetical protein
MAKVNTRRPASGKRAHLSNPSNARRYPVGRRFAGPRPYIRGGYPNAYPIQSIRCVGPRRGPIRVELLHQNCRRGEKGRLGGRYPEREAQVHAQPESVDTSLNAATFTRPDGIVRTIAIEDYTVRRFIRELHAGDEIELTYTEAAAVDDTPAP